MDAATLTRDPFKATSVAEGYSRFADEFEEIRPLFRVSTLDVLSDAYREAGRFYHTDTHVVTMLRLLGKLRGLALDPVALKAAIFFHDAVYHIPLDPQYPPPRDNEERSIKLMLMMANNPQHPSVQRAIGLIRATASHVSGKDIDTRLIHDIDLSILASSRQRFARFEQQIRQEYAVYPLALYCTARMGILRSFMERRRIYALGPLVMAWEARARSNLAWALDELSRGRLPGATS
jgi:predicted metal-dependent HD superfamily phosphohydrolase